MEYYLCCLCKRKGEMTNNDRNAVGEMVGKYFIAYTGTPAYLPNIHNQLLEKEPSALNPEYVVDYIRVNEALATEAVLRLGFPTNDGKMMLKAAHALT